MSAIICCADHVLPRLPVILYAGSAGSMLVGGTEPWTRHLPERFFGGRAYTVERLGCWPVWYVHRLLEAWRQRVDLVAARVDHLTVGRFPGDRYLRIPEWIRMTAPVGAADDRLPSASARSNAQLVRQNGLRWRVSHDPRDLAVFISRDYRPYTRARHGEAAFLRSWGWFFRRYRHGGLVWIEHDQEPVAGMTYDVRGRSLRQLAVACARGDVSLLRTGGIAATYLACFDLARDLGCDEVDFRNCRPFLTDPLFQTKRSWGGRVAQPDDLTHDIVLGWDTATPPVMRFLSESPVVVRDGSGFRLLQGHATTPRPGRLPPGTARPFAPQAGAAFGEWVPLPDAAR
jgi:hypothetical protein